MQRHQRWDSDTEKAMHTGRETGDALGELLGLRDGPCAGVRRLEGTLAKYKGKEWKLWLGRGEVVPSRPLRALSPPRTR
jgi:hypothetical protein